MKTKLSKILALALCAVLIFMTVAVGFTASAAQTTETNGFAAFTSATESDYVKSGAVTVDTDNAILGDAAVYMPTPTAGTTVTASMNFDPVDFSNADAIYVWVNIPQETLDAFNNATSVGALELYFEIASGGGYASECARYLFRATKTGDNALCKTVTKAGWNKIRLPKNFTISSGNYVYQDNIWCGYGSGQTNYYTNWSAINYMRVCYKGDAAGLSVTVGGMGFGFDTCVNGNYAGDDLAAVIAAADDSDTVTLNNDFVLDETIVIDRNITVDLNGHNLLSSADYVFTVANGGLLNLKDERVFNKIYTSYGTAEGAVGVVSGEHICSHRYDTGLIETADCYNTGIRYFDCRLCGRYYEDTEPLTHNGKKTDRIEPTCMSDGNIDYWYCDICDGFFSDEACQNKITLEDTVIEKLDANYIDEDDEKITYTGNWTMLTNLKGADGRDLIRASKRGSLAQFAFSGESFAIIGYKSPTYGKISVSIDGKEGETVDLYNPTSVYQQTVYEKYVGAGIHTVTVTVLDQKNAAASGKGLFYAAIDRLVTDGSFIDANKILDEIDVKATQTTVDITVDIPFNVDGERADLKAEAVFGEVNVTGENVITYTAKTVTAQDTVTYYVNGYTGKVDLSFEGTSYQFEDMPAFDGWSVMNTWHFDGRNALIAKKAGTEYTFEVNAAAIRILGYRSNTYGSFEVWVDGQLLKTYNEYVSQGYLYKDDLGILNIGEYGKHTVTVKTLGKTLLDSISVSRYENFFAPAMSASDRGEMLYDVTYKTMVDRITEYGYAPTSYLTDDYQGMFTRDSSYQIMAHIADNDPELAKSLIEYIVSYHKQGKMDYAAHIMNDLTADVEYSSQGETVDPGVRYQESCGTGLFGINAGAATPNGAAQYFVPEYDFDLAFVDLVLSTASNTGYFELRVTEGLNGKELATARLNITEAFTGATWKRFALSNTVSMKKGTEYAIHIRAYDNQNLRTVAWGTTTLTNFRTYAYDLKLDRNYTLGYRLLTMAEAGDDSAIRFQTQNSVGLYGINAGTAVPNGAAQYFIPMKDVTVGRLDLSLSTASSKGYFEAEIRENDYNGKLLASQRVQITEAFTAAKWVEFKFDKPVTLSEGKKYAFTIRCYDNDNLRTVAWGKNSIVTFQSYAYDVATVKNQTLAYRVYTPEEIGETGYYAVDSIANGEIRTLKLGNSGKGDSVYAVTVNASYDGVKEGQLYADLYKGTRLIKSVDISDKLTKDQSEITVYFGLSIEDIPTGDWTVNLRAVGFDDKGVTLYGDENGIGWTAAGCLATALSTKVQVDANFIFVRAYALFANSYFDKYPEFIAATFDEVMGFSEYFLTDTSYYDPAYGIVRNPNFEHGREGRYWDCYDLLTNVFASQSSYDLSKVAARLGRINDSERLMGYATDIADGIHNELTCEINGKTIYTEMIAIDEDYALYKGFSFVTFAPIAADWFAMDDKIFANTYAEYRRLGNVKFGEYDITSSYVTLNANDTFNNMQSYITGKALGWELLYCYQTGDFDRAKQLLDFIDDFSSDGGFDEGYFSDGRLRDTANQEHASVILWAYAIVTGKYDAILNITDGKSEDFTPGVNAGTNVNRVKLLKQVNGGKLKQEHLEFLFTAKTFTASDNTAIKYRVYVPTDYDGSKEYPVVTFLHGSGERGSDNISQLNNMMLALLNQENDLLADAIIVAPQCPTGQQWVDTPWANGNYSVDSVPESNELKAVVELLSGINNTYSTDMSRQYVIGLSMGSFGTWDLIMRHKELFTAAIPVCGGADVTQAEKLKDFPIFTVHGDADPTVPVEGTRAMVEALQNAGSTCVSYVEVKGGAHNVWNYTATNTNALSWLFEQTK